MEIMLAAALLAAAAAAQTPAPVATPSAPPSTSASPDPAEIRAENNRLATEVRKAIAGQEDKPSKEVFKNVLVMGDLPAGRLLAAMEGGFSRALGVSCTHCHVTTQWDSDDKRPKKATRDMMKMVRAINEDYIKPMKNLEDERASVSCMTCHRGEPRPGSNRGPRAPMPPPASPVPSPAQD